MIVIIDNYDSFTYNLVQEVGRLGYQVRVFRNDAISVPELQRLKPRRIIISPGPGRPENAGITVEVIQRFGGQIPLLGVCLGHQAIGYAFGARIIHAPRLMHGKTSFVYHDGKRIYRSMENPFEATRYHSLLIDKESLPRSFIITAWTREGEIMGIRHRTWLLEGVQFHPESFMTVKGGMILKNFLKVSR
ncbi:MAG: anthranilate/aminodeoxychorismate synthase component II [Elusimicrobia bacterium]|nr:anthranilate/aminodeoxychorismate synthase component II [Elusimicrobiota bacterium]